MFTQKSQYLSILILVIAFVLFFTALSNVPSKNTATASTSDSVDVYLPIVLNNYLPTWIRTYGQNGMDEVRDIQQTKDGGYIIIGSTISSETRSYDILVMKLNGIGEIVWQKMHGGSGTERAYSIQETQDGNFVVAGSTDSFGSGFNDSWVLKLSNEGTIIWQKAYGSFSLENTYSMQETHDEGFILAGESFGSGPWIVKLNNDGDIAWQKAYSLGNEGSALVIKETKDNGFIFAVDAFDIQDALIIKLSSAGDVIWQKAYGGELHERVFDIVETEDAGFLIAGFTNSFGTGWDQAWLLKLSNDGNIIWQKAYGSETNVYADSVLETSDNQIIMAGSTYSAITGHQIAQVMKLSSEGDIIWQKIYEDYNYVYSTGLIETQDNSFVIAGSVFTDDYDLERDGWLLKLNTNGDIYNCDKLQTSNAIATSINGASQNLSTTAVNTNAVVVDTNAIVRDSLLTETLVCPENTSAEPTCTTHTLTK